MKSPTPEAKCAKGVFQVQFPISSVNFSNNISIDTMLYLQIFPISKSSSLTCMVQTMISQAKLPTTVLQYSFEIFHTDLSLNCKMK